MSTKTSKSAKFKDTMRPRYDMSGGILTSAPTIPCSRKATRSEFSILFIRFMVLLFKSSAGPSGEMAQSLSSIEAENG